MTTVNGTILEGVDNEVLLAFVALLVITILTVIYFLNVNRSVSSLSDSWRNLRTIIANQAAVLITSFTNQENQNQSYSGSVQEDNQSSNESTNHYQNERSETVTNQDSGLSNEPLIHTDDSLGAQPEDIRRGTSEEGLNQGNTTGNNSPGGQAVGGNGDNLRHRAGYSTSSTQSSGESSGSQVSIRVKHHEEERSFVVDPNVTVGQLKRLSFPDEVAQGRRVRFVYSGRLLHDESASISFYGISNYSVVHAQISDISHQNAPSGHGEEDIELDISRLFIPVLTFILCGCWYGLISYRNLFSTTSTAILLIITAAYALMVYVMFS